MRWESAAQTHRGNVRAVNEDALLDDPARRLWAVADGMGGHEAGDYASQSVTHALRALALETDLSERVDAVEDTLLDVNDHLRNHARLHCDGQTVGCTVVTLLVEDNVGVALWAGDSRLYRMRDARIEQITRDHNPVSDLLDSGGVTEEQAEAADTNIITRAVGGQRDLHLDVAVFDVLAGDTLLLCTDGLYRELDQPQLQACLEQRELNAAVDDMRSRVLAGAARDNLSMVMVRAVTDAEGSS
ncbi:MAG: protein phosphatase 2C domain-containing protein [Pseudomonadota bacterium]